MYATLLFQSVEGNIITQRDPFWIPEQNIKFLSTPPDNCDGEYFWKFFEDRRHLIEAGY